MAKHASLEQMDRLLGIMAQLRDPQTGCPWDLEQNYATIAPYTIEEAYEVADAIAREDLHALKDELGDLLLQVVFHARMAEEEGAFDFADVAAAISNKMERRHPHVFGNATHVDWEAIKEAERAESGSKEENGALAGVALGLPALLRAEKLQKRAARTGFDWPDAEGARAKVLEELAEVDDARDADALEAELGDLLFAVVNWARKLNIDPEAALRRTNQKFESRFRVMERIAGNEFADLSLDEKEVLWQRAKADEAP